MEALHVLVAGEGISVNTMTGLAGAGMTVFGWPEHPLREQLVFADQPYGKPFTCAIGDVDDLVKLQVAVKQTCAMSYPRVVRALRVEDSALLKALRCFEDKEHDKKRTFGQCRVARKEYYDLISCLWNHVADTKLFMLEKIIKRVNQSNLVEQIGVVQAESFQKAAEKVGWRIEGGVPENEVFAVLQSEEEGTIHGLEQIAQITSKTAGFHFS